MQDFSTPMMKQYRKIKKQYHDCLLFFRMGDFYELFMDDAYIGAKVLNIALTSRPKGKDGRIPMAGVPYHAVNPYLAKLVKAGYKVAICEQVSLPNKYGIVDREVIRTVTPGTVLDENALDKKENNYIISIALDENFLAITVSDISTGYFSTTEITYENLEQTIQDELSRLNPAECILPEKLYNNPEFLKILNNQKGLNIYCFHDWNIYASDGKDFLKKHFEVNTLSGFAIEDKLLSIESSAALLGYLKQTQKATISHIKKITTYEKNDHLIIDQATMINLELFTTIREHDTRGTLLNVLDQTITAMGGRLLKQWLRKPLTNKEKIEKRLDAVSVFLESAKLRQELRELLKEVNDVERILSRLSVGIGNARDLINLRYSLQTILYIKEKIKNASSSFIQELRNKISSDLQSIIIKVKRYIADEPPIDLKSGGLIRTSVNKELDALRQKVGKSKEWVLQLESKERKKTGINSLKVRFNKIFGYYIEISNSNLHLVPQNYIRKQTLVNGERYITPELKIHEEIILTAEEKINKLEYKIFLEILNDILKSTEILQEAAGSIAIFDCLLNFAHLAEKEQFKKPHILSSQKIQIKGGRHPVVEKLSGSSQFVPNGVSFDNKSQQLLIITGPNMAGKSVFIRQIAIIVLMAQIGCFVPAKEAHISLVDRIFVRSGASDVITSGLSTFMVEMVETAHILHHATKNSLIILDEIGRGTSTYDGISIAWAVAEYLVTDIKPSPKTLFATHYHELQVLEELHPEEIKNYHMAAADDKGKPVFLYTLLPGGTSHSFGVAVAKLAGIPQSVIKRAMEILKTLEKRDLDDKKDENKISQAPLNLIDHAIRKELENLDIHQMTPIEALNKLADLKNKLKLYDKETNKYLDID